MPHVPVDLVFHIPAAGLPELLQALEPKRSLKPEVIYAAGADGGGELVTVLVQLGPAVLTFVAGIATAWIRKPNASVEIGNIKVKGVSRKAVEAVLKEHLGQATAHQAGRRPRKASAKKPVQAAKKAKTAKRAKKQKS
jgi:hypothetical protein